MTNNYKVANLTDTWFTIPANAEVELKLLNIVSVLGARGSSCKLYTLDNTNVISADVKEDGGYILTESTSTITTEAETAVKCLGMWLMLNGENSALEFDVELYVNGERWI